MVDSVEQRAVSTPSSDYRAIGMPNALLGQPRHLGSLGACLESTVSHRGESWTHFNVEVLDARAVTTHVQRIEVVEVKWRISPVFVAWRISD
jgi:hypothetical protein